MIPVKIILDTDIGSDCDDAGALAVLHALANKGEADILACLYSSERNPYGAGCIAAINAYYGRPDIPIGAAPPGDVGDPRNDFLEAIATRTALYGHSIVRQSDACNLVTVYRRALANAPDGTVNIVSIGHTKGLHDLLKSCADTLSPLPGRDLVKLKVKTWVAMGGTFPQEETHGWNFGQNGAARYSRYVIENWPTPIVFSGFEIGARIQTGESLTKTSPENPVREAYRLWLGAQKRVRPSWDQTAILYAVRGLGDYWDLCYGRCLIDEAGCTGWLTDSQGPHAYLLQKMKPRRLETIIDNLMCQAA